MGHDLDLTFAEIFPDPRDLKRQILEILPHISDRGSGDVPILTMLAIKEEWSAGQARAPRRRKKINAVAKIKSDVAQALHSLSPVYPGLAQSDSQLRGGRGAEDEWSSEEEPEELDNLGNPLREFSVKDWDNPDLQLSLVKTDWPMGRAQHRYVALSYCWPTKEPEAAGDALDLPVTIIESDGSCRPSRAASQTLRRAVKHAINLGYKYIWIDQECINQNDAKEKEVAIQNMDRVYRDMQAHILCLLDQQINKQEQVCLLEALHESNLENNGAGPFDHMCRMVNQMKGSPKMARILAQILRAVADNRWFTRAWIMHERLCAATRANTELWLTCKKGLRSKIPGEVRLMAIHQLHDAHELAWHLEHGTTADEPEGALQLTRTMTKDNPSWAHTLRPSLLYGEWDEAEGQKAAEQLRLAVRHFKNSYNIVKPAAQRGKKSGIPLSLYGAMHITHLLGSLGCLLPTDKFAMLANIRRWTRRLDTTEIKNRDWSFSLCTWLLTIANQEGSFACPGAGCTTNASEGVQAWAPHAQTKVGSMRCTGLVDSLSTSLHEDGLHASGWLWKAGRFLDLSDLKPVIETINQNRQDEQTKLRQFFWALLGKLSTLREHECADLIWEAVKVRNYGGFYGRSLSGIPIATFDKVMEPGTNKYIACYETLEIPEEKENDSQYLSWGPLDYDAVRYLRRNCIHAKGKATEELEEYEDEEQDEDDCGREPMHALLGKLEQLAGLAWIRSAILNNGGLSLGRHVPGTSSTPSDWGFGENKTYIKEIRKGVDLPAIGIIDLPAEKRESHVFTVHREVRKYRRKDGKALSLVHPFDVWLQDSEDENHTDAPPCWEASVSEDGGIQAGGPRSALFDIGGIDMTEYVLGWPEVYSKDTWD